MGITNFAVAFGGEGEQCFKCGEHIVFIKAGRKHTFPVLFLIFIILPLKSEKT